MEYMEKKQVFSSVPDIGAWYPTDSVRAAGDAVYHCLEQGEGIALIFGETGMGKTLLLQDMAELFDRDDAVVFPLSRIDTAKSLLQQILHGLHQTWCGCSENEMRLMLRDYFQQTKYQRVIILLDEAQSYRFSVFEEIRSLLDHWSNRGGLVRVAMAGTSRLEERLNHPKLVPFLQRVVTRVWLEPFTPEETSAYLDREISRMDGENKLYSFTADALKAIYRFSEGIPRRINQLAHQTIFHSIPNEVSPAKIIEAINVERAWSELQQIPFSVLNDYSDQTSINSVNNESININNDSVVEFGTLSDDDDDSLTGDSLTNDSLTGDSEDEPVVDTVPVADTVPAEIDTAICDDNICDNNICDKIISKDNKTTFNNGTIENGTIENGIIENEDTVPCELTDVVIEASAENSNSAIQSTQNITKMAPETSDLRIFRFDLNPEVKGVSVSENTMDDDYNEKKVPFHKNEIDHNSVTPDTVEINEPSLSELVDRSNISESTVPVPDFLKDKEAIKKTDVDGKVQDIDHHEDYLEELVRLEEEVTMEARIIRQIRDIHGQLRNAHSVAFERSQTQRQEVKQPASDKEHEQVRSVFRQIYKDE